MAIVPAERVLDVIDKFHVSPGAEDSEIGSTSQQTYEKSGILEVVSSAGYMEAAFVGLPRTDAFQIWRTATLSGGCW